MPMSSGIHMQAKSLAPIIERTYIAGGDFQWAREVVVNALQAGAKHILFSVEWEAIRERGVYRRLIADDGHGMSAEELIAFFNSFGGGGRAIGVLHENFGVGAKTSLLPWNKHGVVVCSWKDGVGSMIRLMMLDDGEYGLKNYRLEDDTIDNVIEPGWDDELGIDWSRIKPDWIDQHGTVIVLLGSEPQQNTILNDPGREETGQRSLIRYLNSKLWELPQDTTIEVMEFARHGERNRWPTARNIGRGRPQEEYFERRAHGLKHFVAEEDGRFELQSGTIRMPYCDREVLMHWYLWSGPDRRGTLSHQDWRERRNYQQRKASISLLYQNELYNHKDHGNTYRMFGISEEEVRRGLWIVIEAPSMVIGPPVQSGVYPTSDRGRLTWTGSADLDKQMQDWSDYFANHMPQEIVIALRRSRQDEEATSPTSATWRERLKSALASLAASARLVLDPQGADTMAVQERQGVRSRTRHQNVHQPQQGPRPSAPRRPRSVYGTPGGGEAASRQNIKRGELPEVVFRDEPLDETNEQLLATYTPPSVANPYGLVEIYRHQVLLTEIVLHYQSKYPIVLQDDIRQEVEDVYRSVASAKIAHSDRLRSYFDRTRMDMMRSPEALTLALCGWISEDACITRELDRRFDRLRRQRQTVAAE